LAFIFGGLLIPLDFYPQWLQTICKAMPFSSTVYGPARLFVSPTLELFVSVMLLQVMWIAILGLCLTLVYRRGLAQLTVNGG
jgi:ABC-2 type transport system permease protein